LCRPGHSCPACGGGTRDLVRIRAAVARDEHEYPRAVAVEDERLDDPLQLAADRCCSGFCGRRAVGELLDARLGARGGQSRADPFDRFRPGPGHQASEMNWASSKPSAWMRSRSSGGAGASIANAISAFPASCVRDTAMLAMLTPCSPNIVPTRPITPGMSV